MNRKKLLLIIIGIIAVIAIPVTMMQLRQAQDIRQRAADTDITVSIQPATGEAQINNDFPAEIILDTKGQEVSALELIVSYDKDVLNIVDADFSGTQFGNALQSSPNNSTGTFQIFAVVNSFGTVNGSDVVVAKLNLKGIALGSSTVSFSKAEIGILGQDTPPSVNIISATYTISENVSNNVTPTPEDSGPTPTPDTSVTVTPTPPSTPTNTPAPTPTVGENDTVLNFSVKIPAIGLATFENNTPISPQREVVTELFDNQNAAVSTVSGLVTFSETSGLFDGSVNLGDSIISGAYTLKVKLANSLKKLVPGIVSITNADKLNSAPSVTVVTGDLDGDNEMTVLDYNIMIACTNNGEVCTEEIKALADLNDDANTDGADLNLLYTAFGVRIGD